MVRTVNVLESPKMDKSLIKAKFYSLVQAGLVFYEQEQKTVEYLDKGLKVQASDCTTWRIILTLLTAVSVPSHFSSGKETDDPNSWSAGTAKQRIAPAESRRE